MNNAIYEDPGKNINCKEFEVDKQIISKFIINELIDFVNKPYPLDELLLMVAAVCRFKPKIIIEWGTDAGTSARIFYETYKKFNINTEIHSIDLPDRNIDGMYTNIKNIKEINLYLGDGVVTAIDIIKKTKNENNILFFIDGDHSYEAVKNELKILIKLFPNSIFLLHDTVNQSADSGYNIGPYKAMMEVLLDFDYKIIQMNSGGPGMSLIYKL